MDRDENKVRQDEVVLVSRDELTPTNVPFKSFLPREKDGGFRHQSFYLDSIFNLSQLKNMYYKIWRRHPWIRAMVNKIAKTSITVGWNIKYIGKEAKNDAVFDAIYNFFQYPNYQQSFEDILMKTIIQMKLFGESFWEIVKSEDGNPKDFYILDGTIQPILDIHGNPEVPAYVQKVFANEAFFNYDEILWFKFLDPIGNIHASSDLESLEFSVLLDIKAMDLNRKKFNKGIRIGKAFVFKADLSDEQMERNREQVNNIHEGVEGSYSAFISLQGEVEMMSFGYEKDEMESKDLRSFIRDEMSATLGTPVAKLGILDTQVKESEFINKTFFDEEVKPLLDIIENTINRYLDLVGILDYRFIFKEYPIRDLKETSRLIDVLKRHGIISINEAREMVGLPQIKNGDDHYILNSDGTIVKVNEIDKAISERRVVSEQPSVSPLTFSIKPGRKVVKIGNRVFPAVVREEEEVSEDLDAGGETEVNPT